MTRRRKITFTTDKGKSKSFIARSRKRIYEVAKKQVCKKHYLYYNPFCKICREDFKRNELGMKDNHGGIVGDK